ncbi:MAG: efflux RND transporter periplasmic adaptor subunit [Hyphomicrobium sp.]|nr:efflux RND transporter periplasmic adaptor subunit [Hyphomicrobium sp.]
MTRIFSAALFLVLIATTALVDAGDDHAHDEPAPTAGAGIVSPRLELTGSNIELVAALANRQLTIYLDQLASNEPIDDAIIAVTADGIAAGIAKAAGSGTYALAAPWADEPGVKVLKFSITSGGATAVLEGKLEIETVAVTAHSPTTSWQTILREPQTWIVAGGALVLGFLLAFTLRTGRPRRCAPLVLVAALMLGTYTHPARGQDGHDHGDEEGSAATVVGTDAPRRLPDGEVFLPKPSQRLLHVRTIITRSEGAREARELIGTVVPDPSTFGQVQAPMDGRIELPERGISHVGQHVKEGEVLALLSPSIPIADLGTMQQLTAEVVGKLRIAEQKLSRLTRIAGVVAQKDIDDTRAELDALREQQRVLAPKDAERIELKAPVSGIVSLANVRAGQVVTTRDTLFEIVDPHRLWIEAIGSAAHAAPDITAAYAKDPDGHSIKLSYVGRAPSLRQQAQPLQFKVDEIHEGLVIGSAVKVFVQQGDAVHGTVLPDAAVVRGPDGLPRVWVKVSAEHFRPVPIRLAPLDGTSVLVVAGLEAGSRVVVEGAELINQVR